MKRKLLATLLALCLIVGMIPVAASANSMTDCPGGDTCTHAAAIGNTHYDTLAEALNAAVDGNTVVLLRNATIGEPATIDDGNIIFDMNGQTVSYVPSQSNDALGIIDIVGNSNVTVTGNGSFDYTEAYSNSTYDEYGYIFRVKDNANLTIENGNFHAALTCVQVGTTNPDTVATATIAGGTYSTGFSYNETYWHLNLIDYNAEKPEEDKPDRIIVTGGTFVNYNPAQSKTENPVANFVADGYTVEVSDNIYTVVQLSEENAVAQVDGGYYDSLQDAINAAERGETVVLLKDTTENVTIASGKDLQLDLNGKTLTETTYMDVQGVLTIKDRTATSAPQISSDYETVTYQSGKIANTGTGILVSNGGELILESGCVHSTSGNGINVNGNTNMEGWENAIDSAVTITGGYVHSREYGIGVYGNGAVVNVEGGVVVADDNGAIAGNGSYNSDSNGDGVKDNYGGTEINIRGGTVIGHIVSPGYIAVGIYHPQNGELNISGGTIYADNGVGICIRNGSLNISENAQLYASGNEAGKVGDAANEIPGKTVVIDYSTGYNHGNETTDSRTVTIEGGYFSAEQNNIEVYTTEGNEIIDNFITGGYFTSDPSAYLAEGLVAVPSDVSGYAFTVGDKPEVQDVEPATGDPAVDLSQIPENQQESVKEAVSSVKDSGELAAAANTVLENASEQKDAAVNAFKESEIEGASGANNVNVYAQTYLSVTPTFYDVADENKTLTMDITPMYRVVATTANEAKDIKVLGEVDEGANAVVLDGSEKPLENINTMTISVTLPAEFASKTVYIQHKGYEYSATAGADCKITFTNPHGFSEFTFTTDSKTVATIDGTSYTSLQAAVDDATSDDIIVVKNGNVDLSATANKTVKVMNETENNINVTINGVSKTIEKNATETFVYTSGGGGTPSEPEEPTWPFEDVTEGKDWFYDAVAYVYENGIMAGTDETTFEPYMELDRAMAAQLFYNLEGKPTVTGDSTFTDVTSGHWAVDAITWAAQNDIVAGIGGGLYDPDSNVTREQFAVMLYKYARFKGYDLTATGDLTQFPDAGSISSWAETALSWANGKGLINGHENGTIDPKGSTIRAQAASIMANFDQNVAK